RQHLPGQPRIRGQHGRHRHLVLPALRRQPKPNALNQSSALDLSVILPVHNEAESLPALWQELTEVLAKGAWSAEVIFVDDGSPDGGGVVMRDLCARDPRVRLVRLDSNHGLSAAMDAGLRRARGRIVVTMDSDLQNDPRDIETLLSSLQGWDA